MVALSPSSIENLTLQTSDSSIVDTSNHTFRQITSVQGCKSEPKMRAKGENPAGEMGDGGGLPILVETGSINPGEDLAGLHRYEL
jgi:hypothetical protein